MQRRVGDDADRMRARRERDQPDPVAVADQVVGREPAVRRVAAREPGRVVGPVVDVDARRRSGTRPRSRRARSAGEVELALQQAGAAGRIDQPARARLAAARRRRRRSARDARRPRVAELDVAHQSRRRRSGRRARAPSRRGRSRRCRGRAGSSASAGSVLAPSSVTSSMSRRAVGEEEAEAELLQLRRLEVRVEAEHLAEVVGARSRPTTRRPCGRPAAPDGARRSSTRMSRSARRCFSCSAKVRPARPPPRMTTSCEVASFIAFLRKCGRGVIVR